MTMASGRFRISIRYKLFAVFATVIVSMAAVIGTVMIKRQQAQYLDQLTNFGVYLVSYVSQTSSEDLLFGDDLAMSLMVRDVIRNPQVAEVMIVDKNGIIRAHNNIDRLGSVYIPSNNVESSKNLGAVILHEKLVNEQPMLEFSHPIVYQGTLVGNVYLILTRKFIDKDIKKATWFIAVMAGILVIIGAILSFVLSTVLLKPVQALVRGTKEIADGNFNHHVDVLANDEMGDLAKSFNEMAHELRMKRLIEESFGRYVSPAIANLILNNPDQVWMMGRKQEVSLFFADIRGFTSLTEKKPPEEIVSLLNGYFSMATEVIVRHNGYINKFVGDGLMAVFGAPVQDPAHPVNTIRAMLDLRKGVEQFNRSARSKYNVTLGVGMGASVGPVVAGNVGSQTRMEYTVMGDNVNVASRLTQMATADEILISAEIHQRVYKMFTTEKVGPVQVKGREKWVMVYRVLDEK